MGNKENKQAKIEIIRNETAQHGNTKERVAGILTDLNNDKLEVDLSNGNLESLRAKLDVYSKQEVNNKTDLSTKLDRGTYTGTAEDLKGAIDNINAILASDDATLDQLQEIVNFIKQNKKVLEKLGISNIAGLEEALNRKANADHHHDDRYYKKSEVDDMIQPVPGDYDTLYYRKAEIDVLHRISLDTTNEGLKLKADKTAGNLGEEDVAKWREKLKIKDVASPTPTNPVQWVTVNESEFSFVEGKTIYFPENITDTAEGKTDLKKIEGGKAGDVIHIRATRNLKIIHDGDFIRLFENKSITEGLDGNKVITMLCLAPNKWTEINRSWGYGGATASVNPTEILKGLKLGAVNLHKNTKTPNFTANDVGTGNKTTHTDSTGQFVRYTPDSGKSVSIYGFKTDGSAGGGFSRSIDVRHSHTSNITIWGQSVPPNVWTRVKEEDFRSSNDWLLINTGVNDVAIDLRHLKIESGNKATDWSMHPEEAPSPFDAMGLVESPAYSHITMINPNGNEAHYMTTKKFVENFNKDTTNALVEKVKPALEASILDINDINSRVYSQPKRFAGKTMSFFGDSITTFATDGKPFGPGTANWYPGGDVTDISQTWAELVLKKTGATKGFTDGWAGSNVSGAYGDSGAYNRVSLNNLQADYIIILIGTNDANNVSVNLGTDLKPINTLDHNNVENYKEFISAYQIMIEKFKAKYPTSQLVICTNLKSQGYALAGRLEFVNQKIKEIAKLYELPLIDLFSLKEFSNNVTKYTADNIHPNKAGFEIISDFIASEMARLFKPNLDVDAPSDGSSYVRENEKWVKLSEKINMREIISNMSDGDAYNFLSKVHSRDFTEKININELLDLLRPEHLQSLKAKLNSV